MDDNLTLEKLFKTHSEILYKNFVQPCALKFIESVFACNRIQFRFPRSKKKRIQNKWSKRDENYKNVPEMFKLGDTIYGHPTLINKIKGEFKEEQNDYGSSSHHFLDPYN